ncbi:MAG: FABP family protein [Nitriliruptoraceae bacterium]
MTRPELPEPLEVLRPLIGVFSGEGEGDFPTVAPFRYHEEVSFLPRGPLLTYAQHTADPGSGNPMHAETGFLRRAGEDGLELLLAHTFGLTELQEGRLEVAPEPGVALRLTLQSTNIGVAGTAKRVDAVRRELTVSGDQLRSELWMSYAGVSDTQHLWSVLERNG